jgi:hypothetical protein|tara:strand:+ start:94 stop:327 length:234 start_codon:yes stop_codon:yes gene_type:complete
MNDKGFDAEITLGETPNFQVAEEKPLKKTNLDRPKKVDINVLKARVQEIQNKENKKNISIFIFFLTALAFLGIFLSS